MRFSCRNWRSAIQLHRKGLHNGSSALHESRVTPTPRCNVSLLQHESRLRPCLPLRVIR